MKWYKKALIVLLAVFALYAVFTTVDCIRLHGAVCGTNPIITLSEEVTDTRTTYTGLGYTVCYYTDIGQTPAADGVTYAQQFGYGAEFRLFGDILIWAWVE